MLPSESDLTIVINPCSDCGGGMELTIGYHADMTKHSIVKARCPICGATVRVHIVAEREPQDD